MKRTYRVRPMKGAEEYETPWDVDTRGEAFDSGRQYLRDLESGAISPMAADLDAGEVFIVINTVGSDSAYPNEIHWPTTESITLGPDGREIR